MCNPNEWLLDEEYHFEASDDDMQFSPLTCITPALSPTAPSYSPIHSISPVSPNNSPESMSIASESSVDDNSVMLQEDPEITCGMDQDEMSNEWFGFKIVGDNIDKNVRPRHQSIDTRTKSLHYFHAFAVLDWVDLSSQSEIRLDVNPHKFDL